MNDGATDAGYITARQYLRAVSRRWWVIVLSLVLGGLAGGAYAGSVVKQYRSVVTVAVTPTGVQDVNAVTGARTSTVINMDNEVQLVTSPSVAAAASSLLGSTDDPFKLVKQITVAVRANTALMDIAFKASQPARAQQGAHAFATAYLNQRRVRAQTDLDGQVSALQSQLKALTAQLKTLTAQIASLPTNSPTRGYALAQQTVLVTQLSSLQAKLAPLQITTITPGGILSDARLPTRPSGLGSKVMVLGGLLLGLLLGLVLTSLVERVDPRVLHPDDLVDAPLPLLARFPRTAELRSVSIAPPGSITALAFAHLRNLLVAGAPSDDGLTVLVTGARAGEGSSSVALNLAVSLARGGFDTVLVCLDGHSRTLTALDASSSPSVSDVIRREPPANWIPALPSLRVVTPDGDPGSELSTAALPMFSRRLRELAQYVVIEAPSLAKDADAQALAAVADDVLVVVELRKTTSASVTKATALLEPLRPSLVGLVTVPRVRRLRSRPTAGDRQPGTTARHSSEGRDDSVAPIHGVQ